MGEKSLGDLIDPEREHGRGRDPHLLDPAKRAAMLETVNTAIVDAAGGDPLGGLGIWVVIEEIADGSWGVAGNPIGQRELQIANEA